MPSKKVLATGFQRLRYKAVQMETTVQELTKCIADIKDEIRQFEIDCKKEYITESARKVADTQWGRCEEIDNDEDEF